MIQYLLKKWIKYGFILIPDNYKSYFKQIPIHYKLYHTIDIIKRKYNYKKNRKNSKENETLKNIYIEIDRYIKNYIDKNKDDFKVSCKSGCYNCCYKEVFISNDEAKLLFEYTLKNKIYININEAHYQAINKFNIPHEYKKCIFLDHATGKCKVYPVRPLSCRALNVISDPKLCKDISTKKIVYLTLPLIENTKTAIWNSSISGILPSMYLKQLKENKLI